MNPLFATYRRALRQIEYLRGYVDLNVAGNRVERRTDFANCKRPVLLLYGFFSSRPTLDVLERRLRRDGYGVFSVNLGGLARHFNTRRIDDLADFVRAKGERLYARYPNLGPLTIVGHSKGGLIGAYYVKKLGGHRRVRALVTLGAPHNGTPAAYAGFPIAWLAQSVRQMLPMSEFIRRMQKGPWPPGVRFTSIYSKQDRLAPYPSAIIETFDLPYLRNVEVEATHREFLIKKRIYDVILAEIVRGEQMAPIQIGGLKLFQGAAKPSSTTAA